MVVFRQGHWELYLTSQLPNEPVACIRKMGLPGALGARVRGCGWGFPIIVIFS